MNLIKIEVKTNKSSLVYALKTEGHSPEKFGKNGENLLCAAVSVLMQTLYVYLKKNQYIDKEQVNKGYLELSVKKDFVEIAQIPFDMVLLGINFLKEKYPEDVIIKILEEK